jgi:hypothetical protein
MRTEVPMIRVLVTGVAWLTGALALAVSVPPPALAAATYYVATEGRDSNSCAAAKVQTTAKKSIRSGMGCLRAGDTLVIGPGTYDGRRNALTDLPSGSSSAYITIKAAVDGTVVITAGLLLDDRTSFVSIEGLRIQDASGRVILGHHLKFKRMEFKGGCSTGNCTNTTIGSNDVSGTGDILIEDSWFHGAGGRYNVLVYNADRVVLRRVVIRHDGGWTDNGSRDPEAGLNFYNSSDCHAQNVLVIDSSLPYSTWAASFYAVHNDSVPHQTQRNVWVGSMALVGANMGLRIDGASAGNIIANDVFWDTVNGGISFGNRATSATVDRVTIGRSSLPAAGDFKGGIGAWGPGTRVITNALVTGFARDFDGVSPSHFATYQNATTSNGDGRVTSNPFTSGLTYLPRIERGSALANAGRGGGQIGASILTAIGTSGTLVGDAGWNADTGTPLWPWPNEARIKAEMCAGVTRGFCAAPSLTHYVWNYLGNGNPITAAPPPGALH